MKQKLIWISIAGMLVMHPLSVNAQQAQPTIFTLRLSGLDIEKIGKGLGKLPYEDVAALMDNLRSQVIQQQSQPVAEPKNDTPKPPN